MTLLGRLGARPTAAPMPGWHYGQAQHSGPASTARLLAWKLATARHWQGVVRTPWLYGTSVEILLASDLGRCLWVAGAFEPNELAVMERVVRSGATVVDVGANVGLYSLAAARLVGSSGRVLAVEPSARERAALERNLALNDIANVSVDRRALGASPGSAVLHVADAGHAGQNTLGAPVYPGVQVTGSEEVEVTTLDLLLADQGAGSVAVLKIDVEGAEHHVLTGASDCLTGMRPVVLMELQEPSLAAQGSSAAEVVELLATHRYRVLAYAAESLRLVPLDPDRLDEAQDVVAVPEEMSPPV